MYLLTEEFLTGLKGLKSEVLVAPTGGFYEFTLFRILAWITYLIIIFTDFYVDGQRVILQSLKEIKKMLENTHSHIFTVLSNTT